jgi:hypothetical protein
VSVPVSVDHQRVDLSMSSSASAFHQHAACAPRPTPTMIDIGVASPSAQGQAMMSSTLTAATRVRHARLRPEIRPDAPNATQRHDDHGGDKPAGHPIRKPLDRRSRALRFRDHLHDLRQQRIAADFFGAHHEPAGLIQRARDHLAAGLSCDGHGFAGDERFIERRTAFENDAVDRHLFAGTDPQFVAGRKAVDLTSCSVPPHEATRGFRRQLQQALMAPDVASRRAAPALAEQHQHSDDGGRFE